MKKNTLKQYFGFLTFILISLSCTNEENENNLTSLTTNELSKSCDTCSSSSYPGLLFSDLTQFDLEYSDSESYVQFYNPENQETCNTSYFTTCDDTMVLINGDDEKDRIELKSPSNFNFDGNNSLAFTVTIENIPTTPVGGEIVDGVTFAQIHNRGNASRPLARLAASTQSGIEKIYIIISSDTDGILARTEELIDFEDGDKISVLLQALPGGTDGEIKVEITNHSIDKTIEEGFDIPSDWGKSDVADRFYFKTGLYNQATGKTPRISYENLDISLD